MDSDIKLTYSVIAVLIVILGGLAYFLQGNINLPQVKVEQVSTSTEAISGNVISGNSTSVIRKITTTSTATNKKPMNAKINTGSTTLQLPEKITSATIITNKGAIEIDFATDTPETVKSFASLALTHFYDGTRFHRVMRDFMIQGGDPLSKDVANKSRWGQGGPGYTFNDELHAYDTLPQGTLAMANAGVNTNGSQFFIVTAIAGTPWLIGKHTVFGHITKGLDVALRIADLQTDGSDRPLQDVIIEKIEIH